MNGCKLKKFPEKLRQLRKETELTREEQKKYGKRWLTQELLEKRAGIGCGSVSFYEKGSRRPSLDNLAKLSKALRVKMRYFLEEH